MQRGEVSLDQALARRLLWIPEISVDDDGYPERNQEKDIAQHLRESLAEQRTLGMAWNMRIEKQDFRFTDVFLNALEGR